MPVKICLIDDDPLFRAAAVEALRTRSFEVIEAGDAESGLRLATMLGADVAIIDILMPNKDGLESLPEFRRRLPGVRTIAISSGGRGGASLYLDAAEAVGADAVMSKPLDFDALGALVHRLVA